MTERFYFDWVAFALPVPDALPGAVGDSARPRFGEDARP